MDTPSDPPEASTTRTGNSKLPVGFLSLILASSPIILVIVFTPRILLGIVLDWPGLLALALLAAPLGAILGAVDYHRRTRKVPFVGILALVTTITWPASSLAWLYTSISGWGAWVGQLPVWLGALTVFSWILAVAWAGASLTVARKTKAVSSLVAMVLAPPALLGTALVMVLGYLGQVGQMLFP